MRGTGQRGISGILGLLLSAAVLGLLGYLAYTVYMKQPVMDVAVRQTLAEQGMKASDPAALVQGIRQRVDDAGRKEQERADAMLTEQAGRN